MRTRSLLLAVMPVLACGASLAAGSRSLDTLTAVPSHVAGELTTRGAAFMDIEYVDVSAYLTSDADIDAWYMLVRNLRQNFDDICGDTFCEGEYSNIESLRYRCSVHQATGTLGSCVWVFAASNEEINPSTGKVIVDAQVWRCRSPLMRGTSIHDFLTALSGPSPLYAALPGTDRSLYDGLTGCL